jgi:hypothetical protein
VSSPVVQVETDLAEFFSAGARPNASFAVAESLIDSASQAQGLKCDASVTSHGRPVNQYTNLHPCADSCSGKFLE